MSCLRPMAGRGLGWSLCRLVHTASVRGRCPPATPARATPTAPHVEFFELQRSADPHPLQLSVQSSWADAGTVEAGAEFEEGAADAVGVGPALVVGIGSERETTPMLRQIRAIMTQHPDKIVFTQVGSFYELYFEHATQHAPALGLKIAYKDGSKRTSRTRLAMAGFPLNCLSKYVAMAIGEMHKSVVVVDQVERAAPDAANDTKFERRVSQIVSPGTVLDSAIRDFQDNNHILLINFLKPSLAPVGAHAATIGMAWADLGLGAFRSQETSLTKLLTDVNRIAPKEIVIDQRFESQLELFPELKRYHLTLVPFTRGDIESHYPNFAATPRTLANHFACLGRSECRAVAHLVSHLTEILPQTRFNFELPTHETPDSVVRIDARTSETLELVQSIRTRSTVGSFFSCIRRTVTPSGTRLLKAWMLAPSTKRTEIRNRQRLVAVFSADELLRVRLTGLLAQTHDVSRIVQSVSLGRLSPVDLLYLAQTLHQASLVRDALQAGSSARGKASLVPLVARFVVPEALASEIFETVDSALLLQQAAEVNAATIEASGGDTSPEGAEGETGACEDVASTPGDAARRWIVNPAHSPALRKAHAKFAGVLQKKQALEARLQSSFKTVQSRFTARHGHFIAVRGSRDQMANLETLLGPHTIVKMVLGVTAWVRLEAAAELEESLQECGLEITRLETEVLRALQALVQSQIPTIRALHHVLDFVDVTTSFAVLAHEKRLVCPKLVATPTLEIVGGRHLAVEQGLETRLKRFTTNDCSLTPQERVWVISGPNMGGKTTFLRQNALIVLLAQMGSYVPATSATIGIVDRIFTRVGSGDDLYREMSTFMVEMVETSVILNGATKNTLAVMDEVGRGTSGREGLAIAFATLVHLLQRNKCRTLFATHFASELRGLLEQRGIADGTAFHRTSVSKACKGQPNLLQFNHRLEPGISRNSHAIAVAGLAGFPAKALRVAEETLVVLNKRE